ncbi:MAG: helix-turn-helix domain-containing protein [Anaerolineales bacterium]
MKQEIALNLLQHMADGSYGTRELVEASGYSPSTVVSYLKELYHQGLVERQKTERVRPGRPAIVNLPTPEGAELLRRGKIAAFRKLVERDRVLWGPRASFAYWGVPFFGRPDVFSRKPVKAEPFEVVVEPALWLYDNPAVVDGNRYPALERFLAWAATTKNPRYLAGCAALLRNTAVDTMALADAAKTSGSLNRIGYLAEVAEATEVVDSLEASSSRERMLEGDAPIDRNSARVAARWRVEHPISISLVTDMINLYGNA